MDLIQKMGYRVVRSLQGHMEVTKTSILSLRRAGRAKKKCGRVARPETCVKGPPRVVT